MKPPRSILVPVDLSEYSLVALLYAERIANLFEKATITVLVVEEHDGHGRVDRSSDDTELEERTRARVVELMTEKRIAYATMRILVRHGRAASQIVRSARAEGIDLIVMSTHGRTGLGHVLMGSVAEKVVRYAPCPVLTIKPEEFREIVALTEDDVAGSLHLQSED